MPKKTEVVTDLPEPEELSEFIEIPFKDGSVTVPRARGKWKTKALLKLERQVVYTQDVLDAIEIQLGAEQWEFITDSDGDEFDTFCEDFTKLVLPEVFGI